MFHPDKHDTKDEFIDWYKNDFIKRNGGYSPSHIELWFDRVESAHKNIRNVIGGIRFEKTYKLKAQQSQASIDEVKPIIKEILSIYPDYLQDYGFTEDVFLQPTIPQGTHNVIKLTKHIQNACEGHLRLHEHSEDIKTSLNKLSKLLSDLGSIWAKRRTTESEVHVTLTTSAKAFCLLGHLGPDGDSCFRQGSDKTHHKYILGQTQDTYILTIEKLKKDKLYTIARAFGFSVEPYNIFNFLNYYFCPEFLEGDGIESIISILRDIWNTTDVNIAQNLINIGRSVYQNPYGNWSFIKDNKKASLQTLTPSENYINTFICPRCAKDCGSAIGWDIVDKYLVCGSCVKQAFKCDVSGLMTFKKLVEVYGDNGISIMVHPSVAATLRNCGECGIKCTKLSTSINNKEICDNCLEVNYSECEYCETLVPDKELVQFNDYDLCKTCYMNFDIPSEEEEYIH